MPVQRPFGVTKGAVSLNGPDKPEQVYVFQDEGQVEERMGLHGHGLALVPARTETRWFIRTVWEMADAVLFLHSRPHFHYPDGKRAPFNSGAPICLVGYGSVGSERLRGSALRGTYITDWRNP